MQQIIKMKTSRGFIEPATFLLFALAIGGSAVAVDKMQAKDENRAYASQEAPAVIQGDVAIVAEAER